jgi:hypothetical protein
VDNLTAKLARNIFLSFVKVRKALSLNIINWNLELKKNICDNPLNPWAKKVCTLKKTSEP